MRWPPKVSSCRGWEHVFMWLCKNQMIYCNPGRHLEASQTTDFLFLSLFSSRILLHPDLSFPSLLSPSPFLCPLPGLPQSHCLFLLLSPQKKAGIPGIATKHGKSSYKKTRHSSSRLGPFSHVLSRWISEPTGSCLSQRELFSAPLWMVSALPSVQSLP